MVRLFLFTTTQICLIIFFFTFLSCEKENEDANGSVDPNLPNSNCSEAILYNVRDFDSAIPNFSIAVKIGEQEEEIIIQDSNFDFWWARLHPSGTYFVCYKSPIGDDKADNDYSRAELWRFNLDGSNGQKLIELSDYNWFSQGVADWSPNGNYLVMAASIADENGDQYFQLVRTNADGSNPIELTSGQGWRGDPSWSPDGEKIVFVAFPGDYDWNNFFQVLTDMIDLGPSELHLADINPSGQLSNIIQITNDDYADFDPYIAPNGDLIAWETFVENGVQIRNFNIPNQEINVLIERGEFSCCPSWNETSDGFLIHSFSFGSLPYYIAEYNMQTDEYTTVLQASNKEYINPQWLCLPN